MRIISLKICCELLATKISFMNEISQICKYPANIEDIKLGLGSDSRIGKRFLNAGIVMVEVVYRKTLKH